MLKRKSNLVIKDVAKALPNKKVSNLDLTVFLDTTDEWITTRTGIKNRYIATQETTASLCLDVASQLISRLNASVSSIDFIIVATMTPDFATPSVAALVQKGIKASNAMVLDVSAACTGFISALSVAEKYLVSGTYKRGIVIGADCMSKVIDWHDRSTAVLFGDAAAGVIVEASDNYQQTSYIETIKGFGEHAESLVGGQQQYTNPFDSSTRREPIPYLRMDGRDIFDFVSRTVSKGIKTLSPDILDEIDYVIAHQANLRLLEILSRNTGIPYTKFLTNIMNYGNTSAASIPLLLTDKIEDGTLKLGSNQSILFAGFGGGLSWGLISMSL